MALFYYFSFLSRVTLCYHFDGSPFLHFLNFARTKSTLSNSCTYKSMQKLPEFSPNMKSCMRWNTSEHNYLPSLLVFFFPQVGTFRRLFKRVTSAHLLRFPLHLLSPTLCSHSHHLTIHPPTSLFSTQARVFQALACLSRPSSILHVEEST